MLLLMHWPGLGCLALSLNVFRRPETEGHDGERERSEALPSAALEVEVKLATVTTTQVRKT